MIVSVSRIERFNSAHRLHNPNWSTERNANFYGLCNNANYHGHNYKLIVTVTGEVDRESGYLIDIKDLKTIIRRIVTDQFDHRNLNLDVPAFKNLIPSAENIAYVIWHDLRTEIDSTLDLRIKLFETERNFVEYEGK